MTGTTALRRVVVGVDGSGPSREALAWAGGYCNMAGATLEAVAVWHWPVSLGTGIPIAGHFNPAEEAAKMLEREVSIVREQYPSLEVGTLVLEGYGAQALVERSQGAALLVVGSRGHGELVGLLIGSVSEYCVAHSQCPVVVVRGFSKPVTVT